MINKNSFLEDKMTGHDKHEKKNSQYSENNDDLLCPMTYCAPVSPKSDNYHNDAVVLSSIDNRKGWSHEPTPVVMSSNSG